MIVVSDTSPLIHLAAIQRLDILRQLYGEVYVPAAVFAEATREMQDYPDGKLIHGQAWLHVQAVRDVTQLQPLLATIDQGEAEALVLAREVNADLLLIDDGKGRRQASQMKIRVIGLLGVLLAAKQAGLIESLTAVMGELELKASVWWSEDLKARARALATERPDAES